METQKHKDILRMAAGHASSPGYVDDSASQYHRLAAVLERYCGQSHVVILQGTPDPDALSSALALGHLCSRFDIDTTLLAFSGVSHHENRALVKRLGIDIARYNSEFDLSQYSLYSIVDAQKSTTPIDAKLHDAHVQFCAFIDHHREDATQPHAMFVDIRPSFGSTAAILCEYLQAAFPHGLSPNDPEHVRIATALMHGIRSDTGRFATATRAEYEAGAFILPCVDSKVISLIERKVLSPAMLDMFERALRNRRVHDNFILADVGFVRAADRDGIPQVAEFLLAREGTDTVLVFGIVEEKTIDGSLRTNSETINPDEFLKGFLGASPENGQFYGGGNIRDRVGFQIALGFISMHEDKDLVYRMAREVIEMSFLDYIGKAGQTIV